MSELPALPDLWNTQLDEITLDELLTELKSHAQILAVQEKQSAMDYTGGAANQDSVFQRLRGGQTHAVQIYYHYEGRTWCDTLLKRIIGFQLIRMDITETE